MIQILVFYGSQALISTDFVDIEFDEVLKKNGVLKGSDIDDLSDAFETLYEEYEEYFCQEKVEMLNEKNESCEKKKKKWDPCYVCSITSGRQVIYSKKLFLV